MNREDIIKLAKQSGLFVELVLERDLDWLERFATLVASAAVRETSAEYRLGWNDGQITEREACIVDIQMHIPRSGRDTTEYQMAMRMIERIRARGQA